MIHAAVLILLACYVIVAAQMVYTTDRRIKIARNMGEACDYHIERDSTRKLQVDANYGLQLQYKLALYFGGACIIVICGKCIRDFWWKWHTTPFINENILYILIAGCIGLSLYYVKNVYAKLQKAMFNNYDTIKASLGSYVQ